MWFLIILFFISPAYSQPLISDVKSDIIDMPYTPEQQKVVSDFTKQYFEETKFFKKDDDITIDTFLNKRDVDQDKFVSDWATKKRLRLQKLEADLNSQIISIQNELAELDKALMDWNP